MRELFFCAILSANDKTEVESACTPPRFILPKKVISKHFVLGTMS